MEVMKAWIVMAGLSLGVTAPAQKSDESAERYIANLNGVLQHYGRRELKWALMAPDEELANALIGKSDFRAAAAADEMGRRGKPEMVRKLVAETVRLGPHSGVVAIGALHRIGGVPARTGIASALRNPNFDVRLRAATITATWGDRNARPILLDALKKGNPVGLRLLGYVGTPADAPTIRKFFERAKKAPPPLYGPNHVQTALLTLARLRDRAAVADLRRELDNPRDKHLRRDAVEALGWLRDKADESRFIRALKDPYLGVQQRAIEAIGRTRNPKLAKHVRAYAASPTGDPNALGNSGKTVRYAELVAVSLESGRVAMTLKEFNESKYSRARVP